MCVRKAPKKASRFVFYIQVKWRFEGMKPLEHHAEEEKAKEPGPTDEQVTADKHT